MTPLRRAVLILVLVASSSSAFLIDSLFEPLIRPFDLLPDYYLRFDLSAFALQHDAFFRRQYLAEPHPDLEFCLLSYKNLIASVWDVDFQFGLGEVPGNNVFTVLNVAFGYDPAIEVRLHDVWITGGLAHRCFHEIDRSDFPVVYWNKVHLNLSSPNARVNTYWHMLTADKDFTQKNRVAWQAAGAYCVKDLAGLADPGKLDGNNPFIWDASAVCRYAFHRRLSWIFALRGETIVGNFSQAGGYHVSSHTNWYWRESAGLEAFFIRGARGVSLYALYTLDDMPVQPNGPSFTLGDSRFSRNGLVQIGVMFLN
jgi:hypothetical protein